MNVSIDGMELWWLGQSGFRLRDAAGGASIFVDPFLSDHPGRAWPAPVGPGALAQAAAVLCTHEHIDHFDRPALRAANQVPGADFRLVVPEPIVPQALELGIPRERVVGARPGDTLELAGVRIHPVPARHGVKVADAYSFGEAISGGLIRFLGYVVEMGGIRAYHAGDTIPYDGMVQELKALAPQLALLPINGRDYFRETEGDLVGNMNPREAAQLASGIGAEILIPMHWEMFDTNRGFPRDVIAYVAEYLPRLTVLMFGRGSRFVYAPSENRSDDRATIVPAEGAARRAKEL